MGRKSGFVAFVVWGCGLFLLCGLHRLYLGRTKTGVLWFFTLGLCGIGQLIDLFRLGDMVRVANSEGMGSPRYAAPANAVAPVFNVTVNAGSAGQPAAVPQQIDDSAARLLPRS